ncbi:MAG: BolA/IbaG family iron-sulfur metabolism protein [Congregibacter sp.]|nr:BolA/IbaG family iron-sulfur metabolism protein [Congregibacter sp.]
MSVENQLLVRLNEAFRPDWLELDNESHRHSVPANSETHFRLVMASKAFAGKRAVARHQLVYAELADLLAGPIHALAMHLYDPAEWLDKTREAPASPNCLGGSKSDAQGVP